MLSADFIKHYDSRDEEELSRVEQYHRDLFNTLNHFLSEFDNRGREVGDGIYEVKKPTIEDLANWLREQGEL